PASTTTSATLSLHDALPIWTACMPYLDAISWFSSTSTTLNSTLSPYFFSSSSRIGFCILQGPHHVAEKSNNIGFIKSPVYFETRSEEHTSELQSRENLVCRV